jgi:hypothetical protein
MCFPNIPYSPLICIPKCRDVETNVFCHFREATNPIPRRLILAKPRLYAALVLREELKPIPRGPGPNLDALFADNGDLPSDIPPPPSQPVRRNASPPTPASVTPTSSTGSRALAPVQDDDFDNPFTAFAEARRRRFRGVRHGLNFPDSPPGMLLPHRRRFVLDSDPVEQPTNSQSSSAATASRTALNTNIIDLTRESPGPATRIRSISVNFYTVS